MNPFDEWTKTALTGDDFVVALTERILTEAAQANVSDVHFQPEKNGLDIRFRTDGVLHRIGTVPRERTPQIVARLKVLADLLTYKTTVPQEGRVRASRVPNIAKEMRLCTTQRFTANGWSFDSFRRNNITIIPMNLVFPKMFKRGSSNPFAKTAVPF